MKVSPVVIELKRIAGEHNGILKPESVVESARPKSSPLHERFTWDDTKAAQEFRLWEARQLIRTTIQYLSVNGKNRQVRVFVSLVPDREESGYREVCVVLSDRKMRSQMLRDAMEEMERFEQKYSSLKELSELFMAYKKVRDSLG